MMRAQALLLASSLAMGLVGCETDAPDFANQSFNRVEVFQIGAPGIAGQRTAAAVRDGAVALVNDANVRAFVAFESFGDVALADALVAAHARGVDVRVVGDADQRSEPGFQVLIDAGFGVLEENELSAPGTLRFGDGPSIFTPTPGTDVQRPGDHNRMSHNFLVIDETVVLATSGDAFGGDLVAAPEGAAQLGFLAQSMDLNRDFEDEFRQLHGGVFATTPSAFGGPLKSIADARFVYPGTINEFELYFGPQERTLKRVIDEIFAARASVWVAAEILANDFVFAALQYKIRMGYDVRILVDADGENATNSIVARLRDELSMAPSDRPGTRELRVDTDLEANMVIIDAVPSPIDGRPYETRAYVMSQPMLSALPWNQQTSQSFAADAFTDGNLWAVRAIPDYGEPALAPMLGFFASRFAEAQP